MGSGVINHRGEILEVNGGFHENILYRMCPTSLSATSSIFKDLLAIHQLGRPCCMRLQTAKTSQWEQALEYADKEHSFYSYVVQYAKLLNLTKGSSEAEQSLCYVQVFVTLLHHIIHILLPGPGLVPDSMP